MRDEIADRSSKRSAIGERCAQEAAGVLEELLDEDELDDVDELDESLEPLPDPLLEPPLESPPDPDEPFELDPLEFDDGVRLSVR